MTPPERISFAGDEWAQVHANKATVGDYLDLVAALKSDPSAEVFSNAAGMLGTIADKVASTKQERDELAVWVQRNFAPEYAKLGPPAPGDSPDTRELRARLLDLLVDHGNDANLQAQARQIADQYLDDPATVDPTLGHAALEAAVENGDAALFDRLQKVYETSTDPGQQENALRLLVQFDNPALLERALEYSVSSKVRNQDAAIQLAIALAVPRNRDQAWSFIKTHWDRVQAKLTTDLGSELGELHGELLLRRGARRCQELLRRSSGARLRRSFETRHRAHRRLHRAAPPAGAKPEGVAGRPRRVLDSWTESCACDRSFRGRPQPKPTRA